MAGAGAHEQKSTRTRGQRKGAQQSRVGPREPRGLASLPKATGDPLPAQKPRPRRTPWEASEKTIVWIPRQAQDHTAGCPTEHKGAILLGTLASVTAASAALSPTPAGVQRGYFLLCFIFCFFFFF